MKKTFSFLFIFLLLITTAPSYGQSAVKNKPESVGVSLERLQRYDDFLNKEIKEGRIPGAVSYVMRKGQVVHEKSFGYSSLDTKVPTRQDQIFYIMSMTKPIVTTGLMLLYEEGLFDLNDPVSKYLPQFKDLKVAKDVNTGIAGETVPAGKEVTILHVLTHTAGFSHGLGGKTLDNETAQALYFEPQQSIETRVNTLVSLPLFSQPGEQWYYSAATDVVSILIEHFSGMTTAEFLQKRIFDPLEMKDTGYNLNTKNKDRFMPVHNLNEQGELVNSANQFPVEGNTVFGGTHGLFSTARDYMTFCQMLLNNGQWKGKQLLSKKTIEIMTLNQVGDLYPAPGQGFGLGFGVTTDLADSKSLGSVGQYYWSGAYTTFFFIDPKEELIAILLTQLQPYNNYYGEKMRQFTYQSLVD